MTEPVSDTSSQLVSPVIRGLRLLRFIAQGGNTGNLSEVGRLIDVNRVTVMRLLATLEHEGMIERLPQGGHRIGQDFLTMAAAGLGSSDLVETGRRFLLRLCEGLGLSAYLVILDGNDVVYLAREMPESGLVSHIRVGSRVAAHLTAPGRSMLAGLTPKEIDRRFADVGLDPTNKKSRFDLMQMKAQLEEDRKRGCAWSFSGYEAGINACAAAVRSARGVVGALSVVGPEHLFTGDEASVDKIEDQVKLAASELSLIVGGSRPAAVPD